MLANGCEKWFFVLFTITLGPLVKMFEVLTTKESFNLKLLILTF